MARSPRLPRLDRAQLEAVARRLQNTSISEEGRRFILQSLNAASNPQAESTPLAIASLDSSRQLIIRNGIEHLNGAFHNNVFEVPPEIADSIREAELRGGIIEWSLIEPLLTVYEMPVHAVEATYQAILDAYIETWFVSMKDSASQFGCPSAVVPIPSGFDLRQLEEWAREDVDSIRLTYEDEKANQLRRLWDAKPDKGLNYYQEEMTDWFNKRAGWKYPSIMLNTAQKAYGYALERFHQMNQLQTKYRLVGPPPVCPICIDLFSRGHVPFATVQRYSMPIHIQCPHDWEAVSTKQIDCAIIWLG